MWSYNDEILIREYIGIDNFYYEINYIYDNLSNDEIYDEIMNFIGSVTRSIGEQIEYYSSLKRDVTGFLEILEYIPNIENLIYDELDRIEEEEN